MDNEEKYKPHIAHNEDYVQSVAKTIEKKGPLEVIHFEYLNEVLRAFGIKKDPYAGITAGKFDSASVEKMVQQSFDKINSAEPNELKKKTLQRLWDYLAEEDKLAPSELIFVFGGHGKERAKEAAKLYKEGLGRKIMFSGKRAAYMKNINISEAEYYAAEALRQGVVANDIILEKNALNTPENAVNSANILKEMKWLPKSVILITTPFHMRRAYLTFKSVVDWQPQLIRHTSRGQCESDNYFKDSSYWSYVFFEYIKLYGARKMEHF